MSSITYLYKLYKDMDNVQILAWNAIRAETKKGKVILDNVSGYLNQGCTLAIMGPSGCGKTTLLNCLAQRYTGKWKGDITIDGTRLTPSIATNFTAYVPQEDALIGALTVRETIAFSAKLSINTSHKERLERVNALIKAFGLSNQANMMIGTPLHQGISGGQKRRVSVASQLITLPSIVFLDEPTSGLDSLAAYEIILFICNFARQHKMLIVASIHQPSTATFQLFDKVLLLSQGKMVYHGTVSCNDYFSRAGHPIPTYYNPADHLLEITNTDFSHEEETLQLLIRFWEESPDAKLLSVNHASTVTRSYVLYRPSVLKQTEALLHRLLIKSYRDVVVYGVRLAMYMGLAILMGTVWLRLDNNQNKIQAFINAMFFSSAFLSFMAVAYIPAFLEDRLALVQERANGMYGVTAFLLSNVLIGIPFLFIIAVVCLLFDHLLANELEP